ncbi:hypothetical protein NGRA_0880 [Nosema granulosis]|uniref:Uncharacterized protein n=1 Tax=Nosema granulosis TaxID=83296 RepID=A0A9P6KZ66_9MICR|nr:hypothetical protein NGRA_0880 [Nosema granulosis]
MKIIQEIYKEIGGKQEVHVEGFTTEQIYYQTEELCSRILLEAEEYVTELYKKVEEKYSCKNKNEENENLLVKDRPTTATSTEEEEKEDDDEKEEDEKEDDEKEDDEDSTTATTTEEDDFTSPLKIENVGTDYSDASSVDEDTYSEEDENFDEEELKNKPASDLFKVLDKNIRK